MLPDYSDITSRLGDPSWYDENGVPRYEEFHPDMCDVYAKYAALLLVTCQNCGQEFKAAMVWPRFVLQFGEVKFPTLTSIGSFHYGDPPRHDLDGDRCVGETENSEPRRILEFWQRDKHLGWERVPEYEIEVKEEWVVAGDEECKGVSK